ncbi:MAG: hypothetical protein ACRC1W_10165 [Shewanella sp.]
MQLKPKASGHTALTDQQREDWHRLVTIHPDRYDVLLYRATEQAVNAESGALFGDMDAKVNDIVYLDPEVVCAIDSTGANADDSFFASWDGENATGYGESNTILLRLSVPDVPEGSAIEFNTTLANGDLQPQRWYVIKSQAYGEPVIGLLHSCIPCGDSDQIQLRSGEQEEAEAESD